MINKSVATLKKERAMIYINHIKSLYYIFFIFIFTASQTVFSESWTFLVYMARDNSLSDEGDFNMNQMMSVNNPDVNILVYDCHKINNVKEAQKVVITNGKKTILETIADVDSGLEATFLDACRWALQDFPSDKIAIIAWDHGSGILNRGLFNACMRGFCYDDTTGNYLNDVQLMNALQILVQERNGRKIDLFGFDACLMAGIEMMSVLAPFVTTGIASQQTVPGNGYPYDLIINAVTANMNSVEFAQQIVASYESYYKASQEGYTLSACNLSVINQLLNSIDVLSNQLNQLLSNDDGTFENIIAQSTNSYFDEATYMDFVNFLSTLQANSAQMNLDNVTFEQLNSNINACLDAVKASVVANVTSNTLSHATGLSIYFPQNIVEPSYSNTYFVQNNNWNNFITTFINNQL